MEILERKEYSSNPSQATQRGLRRGAVAYTHLGARLARLDRFDSCTLYRDFAIQSEAVAAFIVPRCSPPAGLDPDRLRRI